MKYKESTENLEVKELETPTCEENKDCVSKEDDVQLCKDLKKVVTFRLGLIKESISVIEGALKQIAYLCDEDNN